MNLFGLPLRQCVYCLLHLKVRVAGTLLKHMARELQEESHALDRFEAGVVSIVKTFRVARRGEKKNNKPVKSCFVSAMQGEQIDNSIFSLLCSCASWLFEQLWAKVLY